VDETRFDVVIVGAGIVGLATAYRIANRFHGKSILVVEKEDDVARHQSGHNSGVIHSGIYYKPGSLKAINCRTGKAALEAFCMRENIRFETCGKVIVAADDSEQPRLQDLYERGLANGVRCRLIGPEELRELEPHVRGVQAIHVAEAGIVDYQRVCRRLRELIEQQGHSFRFSERLTRVRNTGGRLHLQTTRREYEAGILINCAGLHSDRVARIAGTEPSVRIVPFRGEYYKLKASAHHLCSNLIYPVPDPAFPFLGVHFTRLIDGGVECGPNAVLAWAREGYRKTDFRLRDLWSTVTYPGFWKVARSYWRTGMGEFWRSWNKRAFVRALQRLMPDLSEDDLQAGGSGVRAQAISPDGRVVDDFVIERTPSAVHVLNAPSPAATSAFEIGRVVGEYWLETEGQSSQRKSIIEL
jgi:L-2-hydroxyglutarate oxidase